MKLLSIRNKDIKVDDRVLFHIDSLDINSSDKIGIIGHNGSGKTTLLRYIRDYFNKNGYWSFQEQNNTIESSGNNKENNIWGVDKLDCEFLNYSGGEKMKSQLASVFSNYSDIYVFDEPTSNLDSEGVNLFLNKIKNLDTYIIISHDRYLLDALTNRTLAISDGKLIDFPGNCSSYLSWLETDEKRKQSEYENYISEKSRLEKVVESKKRQAENAIKKPKNKSTSEIKQIAFGAVGKSIGGKSKSLSAQAKNIEKRIEKLEKKEKPTKIPTMKIEFNLTDPPKNKVLIRADQLNYSYGKKIIFENTSFTIYRNDKIALTGCNGSGKTTLIRLIESMYKDIYIVPKLKIGYLKQDLNNLDLNLSIYDNLKKNSIQSETINRIILKRIGFGANEINKKVGVLSAGERIKLSLAILCVSDVNFLILDEPTNFLDIDSLIVVEELLSEYEGGMIFVSHDSHFVENVATKKIRIKDKKLIYE